MLQTPTVPDAIGKTPLVELQKAVPRGSARVFVKLEYDNPAGSYKDRMARSVIEGAERRGTLRPGMRVVEFTGEALGKEITVFAAAAGIGGFTGKFDPAPAKSIGSTRICFRQRPRR
jgi:cysteine synthase